MFVQKNIACFNVSMDYMRSYFLVKIGKPPSNSGANFYSCFPAKMDVVVTSACTWSDIMRSFHQKTPFHYKRLQQTHR